MVRTKYPGRAWGFFGSIEDAAAALLLYREVAEGIAQTQRILGAAVRLVRADNKQIRLSRLESE